MLTTYNPSSAPASRAVTGAMRTDLQSQGLITYNAAVSEREIEKRKKNCSDGKTTMGRDLARGSDPYGNVHIFMWDLVFARKEVTRITKLHVMASKQATAQRNVYSTWSGMEIPANATQESFEDLWEILGLACDTYTFGSRTQHDSGVAVGMRVSATIPENRGAYMTIPGDLLAWRAPSIDEATRNKDDQRSGAISKNNPKGRYTPILEPMHAREQINTWPRRAWENTFVASNAALGSAWNDTQNGKHAAAQAVSIDDILQKASIAPKHEMSVEEDYTKSRITEAVHIGAALLATLLEHNLITISNAATSTTPATKKTLIANDAENLLNVFARLGVKTTMASNPLPDTGLLRMFVGRAFGGDLGMHTDAKQVFSMGDLLRDTAASDSNPTRKNSITTSATILDRLQRTAPLAALQAHHRATERITNKIVAVALNFSQPGGPLDVYV